MVDIATVIASDSTLDWTGGGFDPHGIGTRPCCCICIGGLGPAYLALRHGSRGCHCRLTIASWTIVSPYMASDFTDPGIELQHITSTYNICRMQIKKVNVTRTHTHKPSNSTNHWIRLLKSAADTCSLSGVCKVNKINSGGRLAIHLQKRAHTQNSTLISSQ
jgi:hypothetical protein